MFWSVIGIGTVALLILILFVAIVQFLDRLILDEREKDRIEKGTVQPS